MEEHYNDSDSFSYQRSPRHGRPRQQSTAIDNKAPFLDQPALLMRQSSLSVRAKTSSQSLFMPRSVLMSATNPSTLETSLPLLLMNFTASRTVASRRPCTRTVAPASARRDAVCLRCDTGCGVLKASWNKTIDRCVPFNLFGTGFQYLY